MIFSSFGFASACLVLGAASLPTTFNLTSGPGNPVPPGFRVQLDYGNVRAPPASTSSIAKLTLAFLHDLALYPYNQRITGSGTFRDQRSIPGTAVEFKARNDQMLDNKMLIWGLTMCLPDIANAIEQRNSVPLCVFGIEPEGMRHFRQELGSLQFFTPGLRDGAVETGLQDVNATEGTLAAMNASDSTLGSAGQHGANSSSSALSASSFSAASNQTELGSYVDIAVDLDFSATGQDTSMIEMTWSLCFTIAQMASESRRRTDPLGTELEVRLSTGEQSVDITLGASDAADQPSYHECLSGIIAVFYKMEDMGRWGECELSIFAMRLSGRKKLVSGVIKVDDDGMVGGQATEVFKANADTMK